MDSIPASCRLFLQIVRDLMAGVRADAFMLGELPARAPSCMARRLAAGLRMVEACLRNLLLAMALEFEHGLVDARGPLGRPHKRTVLVRSRRLTVLAPRFNPLAKNALTSLNALKDLENDRERTPRAAPRMVDMQRLNQRLEQLSALVADPVGRARRLAFHLARNRPGPIHGTAPAPRLTGRARRYWRAEASIMFSAMVHEILTKSRARPSPLPPRRRQGPRVTVLA